MEESRWLGAAEQACEANLTSGRRQKIFTSDDEIDLLFPVVHGHAQLIRPVAMSIADQEVATLLGRILRLRTQALIDEALDPRIHPHAPPHPVRERDTTIPAPTAVAELRLIDRRSVGNLAPGAIAAVDETLRVKGVDGGTIQRVAIRLPARATARSKRSRRKEVRTKIEPVEVVQDSGFVLGTASRAIVILDAQQDPTVARTCRAPYELGVHDVTEMQPAGGRWREASDARTVSVMLTVLKVLAGAEGAGAKGAGVLKVPVLKVLNVLVLKVLKCWC